MFTTLVDSAFSNLPRFMVAPEASKDVSQVVVSDFHSGSNYGLFLNRIWKGTKGNNHFPTSGQIAIRKRFEIFTDEVRQARKGKKVRLVVNGDAIDGDHHASGDVCTLNVLEQAEIHVELMEEFKKLIDWQAGDELFYTRGTQSHVNEYENWIGEQLNAIPDGDFFVWDFLQLETNGVLSWFVHHGPGRGEGPNEGNSMRNYLKNIYAEAVKDERRVPDILYTGHVHSPTYSSYVYRERMNFKVMHGIILPSWQLKTAYAWMKAPVQKNKIGGVIHEIKADGTITVPYFSVMESN